MRTPVSDFITEYAAQNTVRMHMPGHKGRPLSGPEALDITEVLGAGELYGEDGPIREAERNTASLFGTAMTCWSTEGSSQCIRAMLALATQYGSRNGNGSQTILAARNAHRAFLTACALLDLKVEWLWPEEYSLCACPVTAEAVETAICAMEHRGEKPAAVYLTSPDYLGGLQDVAGIAKAAHAHGVLLLVDNAHGAYLKFLEPSMHPMDLGADLCCDSAHKTLPALTGCAYLHIARTVPEAFLENAKQALVLFGSTSPSWLMLRSLDLVNAALDADLPRELRAAAARADAMRQRLSRLGWKFLGNEPLKLTIDAADAGYTGDELAELLRSCGIEPEYADPDAVVLMLSPYNGAEAEQRVCDAVAAIPRRRARAPYHASFAKPEQVMTIREAMLSESEEIAVLEAEGRILAAPAVSCPPAISVAVSGERISADAIKIMRYYGTETVRVVN